MDETRNASQGSPSPCLSGDEEERAIRRAIHDLGSTDYEARAIARTYVLSAGQVAVPILVGELKAEKLRSRSIAQSVALLVASIVLIGPLLAPILDRPWLIPASSITACFVLLLACFLFKRPAWYREAAKLLAKYDGQDVTRAMIDSLVDVWGEEQPRLRAAIIQRLTHVTPKDASWLKDETRERVIALLCMPDWASPNCVDHMLIIARALATVGATEAIPALKGVNCASLQGERRERLEQGLGEIVRGLEELEARQRPGEALLRPAEEGVALVRPVEAKPQVDEGALLKPVGDQDASLGSEHVSG